MAKIRQEITLCPGQITTANDEQQRVLLDTTQYSGSVTYYFEAVLLATSGTMTASLRRVGTTTDDASVNTTSTSQVRQRSASFSPPAGQTQYMVFASGSGNIRAARIIIIQDTGSDPLTATETQIEIGNRELVKSNTTSSPLVNPKYWYFDSSKWDGTCTFYAEAVLFQTGSGVVTCTLQEDNGSFGGWADKVTIASAVTPSTHTRYRSASFTPTSGRNYRIAGLVASNMDTWECHAGRIIVQQAGTTVDSYSETNQDATDVMHSTSNQKFFGQSFTAAAGILAKARFYLRKNNSATGTAVAKLYAHSGTLGTSSVGTGAALATSQTLDVSTLTTSLALVDFTFTDSYQLQAATNYVIGVEFSGGDSTNSISVGVDVSSPSHAGNKARIARADDTWTAVNTSDVCFYVIAAITKLEPQYLLSNTAVAGGVAFGDFLSYFDPDEWSGVSNTYYLEGNNVAAGTSDISAGRRDTSAQLSGSVITNLIERERSSSVTMPGTAVDIDVSQDGV